MVPFLNPSKTEGRAGVTALSPVVCCTEPGLCAAPAHSFPAADVLIDDLGANPHKD
jgi:hypothetical protein